jgi:succinate dehydrogenase / fumarate reductase cytochrome b subunit
MATTHAPARHTVADGVQPIRAGQGYTFVLRKLHSLLGIIPIGAFLLEHLLSNFEALKGPIAYGAQVKFLNGLPMVRVLEWVFIFITAFMASGSGFAASQTLCTTRGPATGCIPPSAGLG